MNRVQLIALIKMGRFFVLIAGIIAYFLGLSIAFYDLGFILIPNAIIGLLILITATLAAHYANEYADVDTDSLSRRTWFSGGSGVLPSKIIPPSWALNSAILLGIICILITSISFYYQYITLYVVLITAVGLLGGWFYSMPPLRLERTPLGEIDNAFLGGFLMPLIAYVPQTGIFSLKEIIILTPVALAVFVNLLGVHWIDRKADRSVGKKTLVVTLGKRVKKVHGLFVILIYVLSALMVFTLPLKVLIAIFLTIPIAIYSVVKFEKSPAFSSFLMSSIMIFAAIGFIIS